MGATRPASGIKAKAHTPNKGSQTALITRLLVSLCLKNPDNAGRVAPIRGSVFLTSSAAVQQFETSLIVFALHDDLARTCKILNLN